MSLIEMDVLRNEHTARLMFFLNAQKRKPFTSFFATNKEILTSKLFLT